MQALGHLSLRVLVVEIVQVQAFRASVIREWTEKAILKALFTDKGSFCEIAIFLRP